MSLRHAALALLFACLGCGASSGGLPVAEAGTSGANLNVQWIGLDARHLAVGSQLAVSFQLPAATDASSTSTSVTAKPKVPAYTVQSSAPGVVAVHDQGNERLLLSVLAPGQATLTVAIDGGSSLEPVVADRPASVTFSDVNRLAAGTDTNLPRNYAALPTSFALLENKQEQVRAIIYDEGGSALNAWGLTVGRGSGAISVEEPEPEQFVLVPQTASGASGTFVAGLADAGMSTLSYAVALVPQASGTQLEYDTGSQTVLAAGLASDYLTQVFGIDDWVFSCEPSASCSVNTLSPAAVRLSFPANVTPGSYTVSVTSPSQPIPTVSLAVP